MTVLDVIEAAAAVSDTTLEEIRGWRLSSVLRARYAAMWVAAVDLRLDGDDIADGFNCARSTVSRAVARADEELTRGDVTLTRYVTAMRARLGVEVAA